MNYKLKIMIILIILAALSFTGCSRDNFNAVIELDDEIKVNKNAAVVIDSGEIYITDGGEYKICGSAKNVQIIIDCAEDVNIILDDVNILNDEKTAVKVKSQNDVTITSTGKQENSITVCKDKTCIKSDGNINITGDAKLNLEGQVCIDCEETLNLNAKLKLTSSNDALKAKEINLTDCDISFYAGKEALQAKEINVYSGLYYITANSEDSTGLYGKKDVNIYNGKFFIAVPNDGIYAEENIYIQSGEITISTNDDGIHAEETVKIDGGEIDINMCFEGIEGGVIEINDGLINIESENDGINAAYHTDEEKSADTFINGGYININAFGDGIDANGSIFVNGGILFIDGACGGDNNAIDFDDEFVINGGTILAAGNNIKAKPPSQNGEQNSVMLIFENYQPNDMALLFTDENGNMLFAADFNKEYDNFVYSSDRIIKGQKYFYGLSSGLGLKDEYKLDFENTADDFEQLGQFFASSKVELIWSKD